MENFTGCLHRKTSWISYFLPLTERRLDNLGKKMQINNCIDNSVSLLNIKVQHRPSSCKQEWKNIYMCQPLAAKNQQRPLHPGMSEQHRKPKDLSQWNLFTWSEGNWKSFSMSQGMLVHNCSISVSTKIKWDCPSFTFPEKEKILIFVWEGQCPSEVQVPLLRGLHRYSCT